MPILNPDWTTISSWSPFNLQVNKWLIPWYSARDIDGVNRDITTASDPEDIWGGWWTYTFSTISDIDTLSSSTVLDTQIIKITWLKDIDTIWEVVWYAKLDGQNKVLIYLTEAKAIAQSWTAIKFWRIHSIENEADVWWDNLGTIYCYVNTVIVAWVPSDTTKIRAIINLWSNNSFNAIFTIPKWKVWFLIKWEVWMRFTWSLLTGSNSALIFINQENIEKYLKLKNQLLF